MGHKRSPSHLKRDRFRKRQWLERRSAQHEVVPCDRIWLLDRLCKAGEKLPGSFSAFMRKWRLLPTGACSRQRDIFPLPELPNLVLTSFGLPRWKAKIMLAFVNLVVLALNFLYGAGGQVQLPVKLTAAQSDVATRVASSCMDFYTRLQKAEDGLWEHLLPDWFAGVSKPEGLKYGNVIAEAVDGLGVSGECDPLDCLPRDIRAVIMDESLMFPDSPPGLNNFSCVPEESRPEYIKLVVKQLRCGKVGLADSITGGGTVLAVSKPGTGKQREVWHGSQVSQAAAPPPRPRHLASPTALLQLEATPDAPVRLSKRDAKCWFDQLCLPSHLRRWMGRPPVTLQELSEIGGMSAREAASFMEDGSVMSPECMFPVSKVWPMGFSWSSFVAQEMLLTCCADSGLGHDQVLACDAPTPCDFSQVFAAATDDAMFFSTAGPGVTSSMARNFDKALQARSIVKNPSKDVNDELNGVCVGVSLEEGMHLAAPAARCLALTVLVLSLVNSTSASPKQVHTVLGMLQWYDLLRRPKLSVYRAVYGFLRDPDDTRLCQVPGPVLQELLLGLVLGVFWRADLSRKFLPLVFASDASTSFGFGASVSRVPADKARELARIAEKQGSYVVLDGGADPARAGRGKGHMLNLKKSDFVHIFSVRSRLRAHINVLEGEAFVLLLRWLLRCRARHSARIVILVDSAVWLGAAAKGRSSTPLNRLLRRAAALQLAGDLLLHLVLVPSSENPSDEPSRGVRVRTLPRPKKTGTRCGLLKTLKKYSRAAKLLVGGTNLTSQSASSSSPDCDG